MARVLKIMSPLFETVDYSQQFLVVGMIPDLRPLEFSAVKYYWSLMELDSIQVPIRL